MAYSLQSRLNHAGKRFSKLNTICLTYVAGNTEFPINASPILLSSDELSPGNPSLVRIERQDWVVDRCDLGGYYPPQVGHKLRNEATGELFALNSMGTDEPPYSHVTSSRNRVILHTVRTKS